MEPGSMNEAARSASGPAQSSIKRTERPVSSASGLTSKAVDMSGAAAALGPAEMRQQQDDGALVAQFGDGRHGGAQARHRR